MTQRVHIPIKCSTCKFHAIGYADGENSVDNSSIKQAICSKNKTYDIPCSKQAKKSGCKDYHLNWNIYNKVIDKERLKSFSNG